MNAAQHFPPSVKWDSIHGSVLGVLIIESLAGVIRMSPILCPAAPHYIKMPRPVIQAIIRSE